VSYVALILAGMGNLLRRMVAAYKLSKGRCENCGAILPDVHPIPEWRACSEACASELWVNATA